MSREHYWIAIVGVAIINGIFSPFLIGVLLFRPLWYPFFLPASVPLLFMLSSLIMATLTIMLAGVPAAIYERVRGETESSNASMWIWLSCTLILSLPAIQNAIGQLR
jgi:hypothetical protein